MIFKKNVFGIDIDIEFDILGSIFKTWQKVYEFRLWIVWRKENYLNPKLSSYFLKYALRYLPNGSFVIFDFDTTDEKFVQFANIGGDIVMNIPVWFTNEFYNRKLELKKILSDSGIKKASITEEKYGKEKIDLKVSFGNHFTKAAEVAILICKEIFNINEPCVFDYKTHNLARK